MIILVTYQWWGCSGVVGWQHAHSRTHVLVHHTGLATEWVIATNR